MGFFESFLRAWRQQRAAWIAVLVGMALLAAGALAPTALAWRSSPSYVSGTQSRILYPSVAVDSTGRVHVAWLFVDNSSDFGVGQVYYVRGQVNEAGNSVSWEDTQRIFSGEALNPSPARVHADDSGVVHVIYGTDGNSVEYLRNPDRGASGEWSREIVGRPSPRPFFNADFGLDDAGVPYVVWGNGVGGDDSRITIAWREDRNRWTQIDPGVRVYLARRPRVAVSGSGSNARIHVVYEYQAREGGDFRIGYIRGDRDDRNFRVADFGQSVDLSQKADFPDITVDRSTGHLYMAFTYNDGTDRFSTAFTRSTTRGIEWSRPSLLRVGSSHAGRPSVDARNGIVHLITEQKSPPKGGYRDLLVYARIYDAEANRYTSPENISRTGERATYPRISTGGLGTVALWPRNNTERVRFNVTEGGAAEPIATREPTATTTPTNTPTSTPVPIPEGEITLTGTQGEEKTNNGLVDIIVSLVSGEPDAVRLSNDGINYTDPTPIPANRTLRGWALADSTPPGYACEPRTVRAQFLNTTTDLVSDEIQDSILIDEGVDAEVLVNNPFLASNSVNVQAVAGAQLAGLSPEQLGALSGALWDFNGNPVDPSSLNVQDFGSGGASHGDPGYTRAQFYYAEVNAEPGECSGIAGVTMGALTSANQASAGVAQSIDDGLYEAAVEVVDGVGNRRTFESFQLYLDTARPQFSNPLSATLEILSGGEVVTTTDTYQVDLRFAGLDITDVGYGDREDRDLWGVWVSNSTESFDLNDTAQIAALEGLDWSPVAVEEYTFSTANNTYDFTVDNWSLFTGLDDPDGGRDQYVYVRVIDGAGNPSEEIMAYGPLTLSQNVTAPVNYLPVIRR